MKFTHLTKHDTARPNTPIFVNLETVNYVAPLISGGGCVISFAGGESVMVTESFDDLNNLIVNNQASKR